MPNVVINFTARSRCKLSLSDCRFRSFITIHSSSFFKPAQLSLSHIRLQSQQFNFTSSCWSPTRPGVFYTSDLHGHVDVWDMLSEHFSPSLRVKVSNTAIRNISAHSSGSLLACGADNGELVVLRVSDSLVTVYSLPCIIFVYKICNNRSKKTKKKSAQLCLNAKIREKRFWIRDSENCA